jgi:2-iminobutanoate/2-iminopropanoate deaminase
MTMPNIERISTPWSYSSAVTAGDFVFLGLHRGGGESFAEQCESTLANLQETLAKLGLTMACLVKVNVWLKNVQDLPEMEKLFHRYFGPGQFPARMTATTQFIDADCLVMIDGVAYTKG